MKRAVASENTLNVAIESIYEAAVDQKHWPTALQRIADCFGDVGATLAWTLEDGTVFRIRTTSLEAAVRALHEEGWDRIDPRRARFAERGHYFSGKVITDRDLVSEEEIKTHPIYTQFCALHGLGWYAAVAVTPDPKVGVVLTIFRNAKERPPYSEAELGFLKRVSRHVEKALYVGNRLFDAAVLQAGYGNAFGRLNIGVVALDLECRVLYLNPTARRLIGDGIALKGGRLVIAGDEASRRLAAEMRRIVKDGDEAGSPPSGTLVIPRQDGKRPLAGFVLPTRHEMKSAMFFEGTAALAVIVDPDAHQSAPDPAVLGDVLGLTPGEARLAALVGSGLSPAAAAAKLHLTPESARTVLKRVFHKAGVSRQSELTALISRISLL